MSDAYLNKTGLAYLWTKIKEYVAGAVQSGGGGSGDYAPKSQGSEFIVSTHDYDSYEWTGVTTDSELYDGKQITYFLKNNNVSGGNVTLTLTFPNGSKSRKCRVVLYGSKQVTTEYQPNSMIRMTYTNGLRQWFVDATPAIAEQ